MKKLLGFLFCYVFLSTTLLAQISFNRDTSITVQESGVVFKQAWAGGINAAQFSEIDLNLDGTKDIIVFDKTGNKLSPFLNVNNKYIFAPEYRTSFPNMHDWVLLEDFNCDGKEDIFTYSSGGIAIYENTSNSSLSFNLITSLLLTNYGGANNYNLFVSSVDIPAISDVDYDGDLDILTFSILGGFVEFHKNMAIENNGNCDSLAFQFEESCWGYFFEGLNSYLIHCKACNLDSCSIPFIPSSSNSKQKHSGSTLLAIDVDNDNDKDLILGDVSYNNLNLLINGGDNQNAEMISVDSIFPANLNSTIPTNIHLFPSPFYLDVTNDGTKDLIVTTNTNQNSENFESVWFYSNNGTNTLPDFSFVSKSFLQEDMIDLGEGAYPVLFDYNYDNLLDLVVGNYAYHDVSGNDISGLALFENVGTNNEPSFDLITRDFTGISNINLNIGLNIPALNIYPTFGDLDGDGDKDMMLGDADGNLHYFVNNGVTSSSFNLAQVNYANIDVGYFSTPQLIDINRDGLLDLLIGDMMGTISYLPNNGTQTTPVFDTIISNFGGIDIDSNYISTGYSTPHCVDINGEYHLYVGSFTGTIYHYDSIDGNLNNSFNLVSSSQQNIDEGAITALCIEDLNNDQIPDMILGNYCGGLSYFVGDTLTTNINGTHLYNKNLLVYPNPTNDNLFIQSRKSGEIKMYNVLGKLVLSKEKETNNCKINVSNLSKGVYVIKLERFITKFVKE